MFIYENDLFKISFNENGKLTSLFNNTTKREYLNQNAELGNLFAIWTNFKKPYEFKRTWESGTPELAPNPCDIANNVFTPNNAIFCSYNKNDKSMQLTWTDTKTNLQTTLYINEIQDKTNLHKKGVELKLTIENTGDQPIDILPVFPYINGIDLGESAFMVYNDQAGYVIPLWSREGGVYGNGMQCSMSWGCFFDNETSDSLGYIIKDENLNNKEIKLLKPSLQVRYFPNKTIKPKEIVTLPTAELFIFNSSWKQVAKRYGEWFKQSIGIRKMPSWIYELDSYIGGWTEKKGNEYMPRNKGIENLSTAMDSLSELPIHHLRKPYDLIEYAFYCQGSKYQSKENGLFGKRVHTDGVNFVREDLGGEKAFKEGIHKVRKMGRKVNLYVEGYIVPKDSSLFEINKNAKNWIIEDADGLSMGNYTNQRFVHMCPGCKEWQDHLADMCKRLVIETDCDGIRLDSLGFYFIPCYNKNHNHDTPFGYNKWMMQLLEKVRKAVDEVKPNCLLATEAAVDYYAKHFTSAYSSQGYGPEYIVSKEDISPMHVALPEYNLYLIGGGPIAASLMGLPGGNKGFSQYSYFTQMEKNWHQARYPVADTITWADTDIKKFECSDNEFNIRYYSTKETDVILGARLDDEVDPKEYKQRLEDGYLSMGSVFNENVYLKRDTPNAVIKLSNIKDSKNGWLFDIESGNINKVDIKKIKTGFSISTNWFMIVVSDKHLCYINDIKFSDNALIADIMLPENKFATLTAKSLGIEQCIVKNGINEIKLSDKPLTGNHPIFLHGNNLLPAKKYIEVN